MHYLISRIFLGLIFGILTVPSFAQAKIRVAITVDDLPAHMPLPSHLNRIQVAQQMLSALKKYKVPEVYGFINAEKVEKDPKLVDVLSLWRSEGYPLGNHSYSHPDLNKISVKEFQEDVEKNKSLLARLSGGSDWKYFRYPFLHEGNTKEKRDEVRQFLLKKKYKIAQVTIDFEDWSWNPAYTRCLEKKDQTAVDWLKKTYLKNALDILNRADKVARFVFKKQIPHILLLHLGAMDAEMMESLISEYISKDVEFISLSDALEDEIYNFDPGYVSKSGTEYIYQILQAKGLTLKDAGLNPYRGYPGEKLKTICR